MDWHTRTEEIQHRYFRSGKYAYLWIDYEPEVDTLLTWTFTFMDLGMYHTLSGHAHVFCPSQGVFSVNGHSHANENAALDCVFAGHYARFLRRFYREMQIFW
jgi:hypothetical protein